MPRSQQLGITVSVVLLGLLIPVFIPLPSQEFSSHILGSELTLSLTGPGLLGFLLMLLVGFGVSAIQSAGPGTVTYRLTFWPAPTALVMISLSYLPYLSWWGYQFLWVGLTGLALAVIMTLQLRASEGSRTARLAVGQAPLARGALSVLVYVEALVLFSLFYGTRARSILSATSILLTAAALALELLRTEPQQHGRTWLYALLVGLMISELTWALNYWSIDARLGGAFLLLVFYTLTGLIRQYIAQQLTRRVIIEYGLLCLAGLLFLVFSRLLRAV